MLSIVASQIGALVELPDIVADYVLNGIVSSFFCICYGLISLCVIYYC